MADSSKTLPERLRSTIDDRAKPAITEPKPSPHVFMEGVTGVADPATHTVQVHIKGGAPVTASVLSRTHDPDMRGGEVFLPKPGSPVIVCHTQTGEAFVLGYLKEATSSADQPASHSIPMADPNTGGAADPLYKLGGMDSRREGDAGDFGPGDWGLTSSEGNGLAIFEGGVTQFKAGDLSQILGFKLGDLIRIVANNLDIFTGMGELKVTTENKKARLEFRGSTDIRDGHPSKDKWDIEGGIGGEASLFHLRFLDPGAGTVKAGITISKDGDIMLEGRTISEHEHARKTAGVKSKQASNEQVRGNDAKTIGGEYTRTARVVERTAESGISDKAGGTYKLAATDVTVTSSHTSQEFVLGLRPEKDVPPVPGQITGKKFEIANANFEVEVGNPANPAGAATWPSMNFNTYYGDINLSANLAGSVVLSAPLAPSLSGITGGFGIILNSPLVLLGGVPGQLIPFLQPGMAVCKFEMLLAYITALHAVIATHIHEAGPVVPSPSLAAAMAGLMPLALPIGSLSVRVAT